MKLGTFTYACCLYDDSRMYKKNTFESGRLEDSAGNLSLKLNWVLENWVVWIVINGNVQE